MAAGISYGERCKTDSECKSKICETKYDEFGNSEGRYCIVPNNKYGKQCSTNNDCESGECIPIYDRDSRLIGKRCKPSDYKLKDDNVRSFFFSGEDSNKYGIVDKNYRAAQFQKNKAGPLAEFIAYLMETVVYFIKLIVTTLFDIFKGVFKIIADIILGGITGNLFFGAITNKHKKDGKCLSMWFPRTILTFLLPPFGVFMARGFNGIKYVLICCVLTAIFYFPGLIYAFIVMGNSKTSEDEATIINKEAQRKKDSKLK
tara:strand:- start:15 stop:791 length:777 start_codon:yes stop_codon:yes gene_type:complete